MTLTVTLPGTTHEALIPGDDLVLNTSAQTVTVRVTGGKLADPEIVLAKGLRTLNDLDRMLANVNMKAALHRIMASAQATGGVAAERPGAVGALLVEVRAALAPWTLPAPKAGDSAWTHFSSLGTPPVHVILPPEADLSLRTLQALVPCDDVQPLHGTKAGTVYFDGEARMKRFQRVNYFGSTRAGFEVLGSCLFVDKLTMNGALHPWHSWQQQAATPLPPAPEQAGGPGLTRVEWGNGATTPAAYADCRTPEQAFEVRDALRQAGRADARVVAPPSRRGVTVRRTPGGRRPAVDYSDLD